ncbi:MAG: aldo/keto reductase, partial [Myxococcota bacterium]
MVNQARDDSAAASAADVSDDRGRADAGHATSAGTAAFVSRHPRAVFRSMGELRLSSIGWSTSRGDGDDPPATIAHAVRHGVNVFDLVPYCRQGAPLRAVAAALTGAVSRSELVLMARVGFLAEPVQSFGVHTQMIEERYIARGLFQWGDLALASHCMAPSFIRHSVGQCVELLGTGIDILWLDTPAAQLAIIDREALAQRVRAAFSELEACVDAGHIAGYGIARPDELQLEYVLELAREVAGERHHLRAVQFPLSLHSAETALRPTQSVRGRRCNILQAAGELGLYPMASNALHGAAAEYEMDAETRALLGPVVTDAQVGLQWARSLPGLGTALAGMRRSAHIEENCQVLQIPLAPADVVTAFLPEALVKRLARQPVAALDRRVSALHDGSS